MHGKKYNNNNNSRKKQRAKAIMNTFANTIISKSEATRLCERTTIDANAFRAVNTLSGLVSFTGVQKLP
jgi:hypothetical protein